ncbi:MAG: hypothetical protein KAJ62_12975 [Desulfobacteraceae bacterium]|nr:hypothetical protein [Desulfobacteraceae bacterium]
MKNQMKLTTILLALGFLLCTTFASWAGNATITKEKRTISSKINLAKKIGLPDLIVSINATAGLEAGEKAPSCKVTVKNIGKALARGTKSAGNNGYMVDIVLSSDGLIPMSLAVYSSNFHEDILLSGGRISNTPDLKPGQSKTFDLSNVLTIPSDTPTGSYCIGGFVDSAKKVKESNERNNTTCKRVKIKGKPYERPFQVTSPGMSQDFQVVAGKIRIKVVFNKPVKKATLVPGTNFKVRTEKDPNANGTIIWVDNHTLIWKSTKDVHDLLRFDPDGFFKLFILDSVRDTTGTNLDGDKDGSAGGTFVNDFVLIG